MTKRIKKKHSIRIETCTRFINPKYYNRPIWKRRKAIIKHSYIKIEHIPVQKLRRAMLSIADTMMKDFVDLSIHKGADEKWSDD